MYADPKNPGLQKYREARAKAKEIAILRNQIRETNPNYSDNQVEEIAKASYRAKNMPVKQVKIQRRGKGKKKAFTVEVVKK